jgi:hypothetical protein
VTGAGQPVHYSIVPSSAGQPIALDLGGANLVAAAFLPGSEPRIVATIGESADRGEIVIVTPKGVRKLGITPGFVFNAVAVSPDGGSMAFRSAAREIALCTFEKPSCRKAQLPSDESPIQWSADGRYLYLIAFQTSVPTPVRRYEIATGAEADWLTIGPADPTDYIGSGGVFISRDGKSYGFSALSILDSSLFVVDGLR